VEGLATRLVWQFVTKVSNAAPDRSRCSRTIQLQPTDAGDSPLHFHMAVGPFLGRDNETTPRLMGRTHGMRPVRAIRRVERDDDPPFFEPPPLARHEQSLGSLARLRRAPENACRLHRARLWTIVQSASRRPAVQRSSLEDVNRRRRWVVRFVRPRTRTSTRTVCPRVVEDNNTICA
jgi:hypothetical protein